MTIISIKTEDNNCSNNNNKKLFTIQYTKEELDRIQADFLEQLNKFIVREQNRILKTMEKIEKEVGAGESK